MSKRELFQLCQSIKEARAEADEKSLLRGDDDHIYVVEVVGQGGRKCYGIVLEEDYSEFRATGHKVVTCQNGRHARLGHYISQKQE